MGFNGGGLIGSTGPLSGLSSGYWVSGRSKTTPSDVVEAGAGSGVKGRLEVKSRVSSRSLAYTGGLEGSYTSIG